MSASIHPQSPILAHPAAARFPMMQGQEMLDLIESVAARGLDEDIVLLNGEVLDGRNRLYACVEAGVKPVFRNFSPAVDGKSPTEFVIRRNLKRRHLSPSVRAALAAALIEDLNRELLERAAAPETPTARNVIPMVPAATPDETPAMPAESIAPETEEHKPATPEPTPVEKAAALFGASKTMVKLAKVLKEKAPDLYEKVLREELTVNAAKNEWEKRLAEKKTEVDKSKEGVERQQAIDAIAETYGADHEITKAATKRKVLKQHAELLTFSGLPKAKGLAVVPLLIKGWTLAKATKYLDEDITAQTTLEELINFAIAKGQTEFTAKVNGWKITASK